MKMGIGATIGMIFVMALVGTFFGGGLAYFLVYMFIIACFFVGACIDDKKARDDIEADKNLSREDKDFLQQNRRI